MRLSNETQRHNTTRPFTRSARRAVAVGATILLQACGSAAVDAPNGVPLSGSVVLQDTWGNNLLDYSGVEVSIDGLSAHATTDTDGAWRIDNVPVGRYGVTLKKATFGTMRILDQPIVGESSVAPKITMAVTPTSQAIVDSIYISTLEGTEFYFVDGHFSAPPPANAKVTTTLLFLSAKSDAVSPDPTTYDQWNASFYISGASSTFTLPLHAGGTRATFGAGTKLFVAGYATSAACSCYDDPVTKKRVFSNAGPRGNVMQMTVK